jgi:hypothetical protein
MLGTPNITDARRLIFWDSSQDKTANEQPDDDEESPPETPIGELAEPETVTDKPMHYGPSMYVKLFEGMVVSLRQDEMILMNETCAEMLKTVIKHERHLLDPEEQDICASYTRLSCACVTHMIQCSRLI